MDPTRTPLRSIHPTKPIRRPKLRPGQKHHVLNFLVYYEENPKSLNKQDSWFGSFPWALSLDNKT